MYLASGPASPIAKLTSESYGEPSANVRHEGRNKTSSNA